MVDINSLKNIINNSSKNYYLSSTNNKWITHKAANASLNKKKKLNYLRNESRLWSSLYKANKDLLRQENYLLKGKIEMLLTVMPVRNDTFMFKYQSLQMHSKISFLQL